MLELIFTKVKLSLAATSNVNVSNFFFLTGENGSGKTALIERIIDEFRLKLPEKKSDTRAVSGNHTSSTIALLYSYQW
jgi:recombinational DNA repair ATPase RecF